MLDKIKKFILRFKQILFLIFLGNKDIKATNSKKSFLRVLFISLGLIIFCILLSFPLNLQLGWGFQEGCPITLISFFFLLLVGFISLEIFKVRNVSEPSNKNIVMWKYLGFCFIYLAFDDLCRFHEEIDHTICKIFGLDKHGPADKIDDLIIVVYGIITLSILIRYFKESINFKSGILYFSGAILMAVTTTVCDLLGGIHGPLSQYFSEQALPLVLRNLDILEETTKTLSEVFFVGAFLHIYHKFRNK